MKRSQFRHRWFSVTAVDRSTGKVYRCQCSPRKRLLYLVTGR